VAYHEGLFYAFGCSLRESTAPLGAGSEWKHNARTSLDEVQELCHCRTSHSYVQNVYEALYFGCDSHFCLPNDCDIRMEFNAALGREPWMDAKTRSLAQKKLSKALIALGGPPLDSPTPSSESFPITSSYTYNYILASEAEVYSSLKRLGEEVHRLDWNGNTATDINSYYNRAVNVLFIPAGILQPPFFDPQAL
jgi:predicted metalloendopeptidase